MRNRFVTSITVWAILISVFTYRIAFASSDISTTELITLYSDGNQTTGDVPEGKPAISGDGRYIAFVSIEPLVRGDFNGTYDIFVRDRVTQSVIRATNAMNGFAPNGPSFSPTISKDGRRVAFYSNATDLIISDANTSAEDVFIYDIPSKNTILVSKSSEGVQGNTTSYRPAITANGRYVAFVSYSNNLVANNPLGKTGIYVRDLNTDTTKVVMNPRTNDIAYGDYPSLSDEGSKLAFISSASDLIANDTNNESDIFLYDFSLNTISLISKAYNGGLANFSSYPPLISADGRFVGFTSIANNLTLVDLNNGADCFVANIATGEIIMASVANDGIQGNNSTGPMFSISGDGRYVAFETNANDMFPNDNNNGMDVLIRDTLENTTQVVSVSSENVLGNQSSWYPAISYDGHSVAFLSSATNLVINDKNNSRDVFLHTLPYLTFLPQVTRQ